MRIPDGKGFAFFNQRLMHIRFQYFAIGIVLGVLAGGEAWAQPSPLLDDYLCFQGAPTRHADQGERFTPQNALTLRDRLIVAASATPIKIDLRKPLALCLPAAAPNTPPNDAVTHLEVYAARLSHTRPTQPRLIATPKRVVNRFGTDELRPKQLKELLIPSTVALDPPPVPPSVPAAIDDFSCYAVQRVAGLRRQSAAASLLTLASGIGTLRYDVRAPVRLCFPADLDGADPSVPSHPNALACYRAKLARTRPPQSRRLPRKAATANRFGSERLTLTTALEFCVPSEVQDVGASPTPTASVGGPTPTPTVTPPPGFTLRINPAAAVVDIGQSAHLTATAVFENGDVANFTERVVWSSGSEIAVAVNEVGDRGRIDAVDAGQAVISVLDAATGVSSTTTGEDAVLTVNWTLQRIELLPPTATRGQGESIRLRATGYFAGGFTRSIAERITYASSDDGVALPSNAKTPADHSRILAAGAGTAVLSAVDALTGVSSTTSGDDVVLTVLPPLQRCTILQTGPPITIATDHDYQLTAHGFYAGGFERVLTQQVVWSSDTPAVLSAPNTEGDRSRLHALAAGEAHVTATDSVTGVPCEGSVTFVVGAPQGLYLWFSAEWQSSRPRRVGRSWHLRAIQSFSTFNYKYVTQKVVFSSNNPSIVAAPNVAGDRGRVDAVGSGTAMITATDPADGRVSPPVSVRALDGLTRVEVSRRHQKPTFLLGGYPYGLEALGHFADGPAPVEAEDVTFVSNNPTVVEVRSFGSYWQLLGVGFGTATISAIDNETGISSDAFGESLRVAVPGPLARLVIVPSHTTRRVGGIQSFAVIGYFGGGVSDVVTQQVDFTSSDPSIARPIYDPSRSTIEAVAAGVTVISAADFFTGISSHASGDDATLTVVGALQRLRVEPSAVERTVGRSFSFTAIGTDAAGRDVNVTQDVTWSSSNPAVAVATNVAGNRSRIDTVGEGTTTISAFDAQDGVSSTTSGDDATLVVSGILESLTLAAETTQITTGQAIQLTATGHVVGGTAINLTQQVEYTSSNPAVAKADNPPGDRSRIETLSSGTAVISARDPGTGIVTTASGSVTLTVVAP